MDSAPMTIYIKQGLEETIMVEVNPSDTVTEVRKKLLEKGGKVDKSTKFIANGRVVKEHVPLRYQNIPSGSNWHPGWAVAN